MVWKINATIFITQVRNCVMGATPMVSIGNIVDFNQTAPPCMPFECNFSFCIDLYQEWN